MRAEDEQVAVVPFAAWAPRSGTRPHLAAVAGFASACAAETTAVRLSVTCPEWTITVDAADGVADLPPVTEGAWLRCAPSGPVVPRPDVVPVAAAAELVVDGDLALHVRCAAPGRLAVVVDRVLDAIAGPGAAPGPRELARLLGEDWAGPLHHPPRPAVLDLVDARVRDTPDAPAVVCGATRLTYADLAAASGELAERLVAAGAGPEVLVALRVGRSSASVVAVLGVLRAGAAYLPVDPALPPERAALLLRTARPALEVTGEDLVVTVVSRPAAPPGPVRAPDPRDLAYVLFTSGSTGAPKGVATERRALDHLVWWYLTRSGSTLDGPVLHFSSLAWDTSTAEILPTLCAGGCVVVATEEHRHDPDALLALVCDEHVARVLLPPQVLGLLAEASLRRGRLPDALVDVASGGERLVLSSVLRRWLGALGGCTVQNHYGPTETQLATAYLAEDPAGAPEVVPIGRGCGDVRLTVLDADGHPAPVGVPGELHIAGSGLARGYLGAPAATAERFVPAPSGPAGARAYRTGDVVCWLPDSTLRFVGRTDDQVKVRGHRVELGEIQAVVESAPGVRRAAVVAVPDGRGSHAAEAFAEAGGESPAAPDPVALRAYLAERLPDYMVPRRVAFVTRIPLNRNGKVDVDALLAGRGGATPTGGADAGNAGGVAEVLARCWAEVLAVDEVPRDADFFALGGDSLAAVHIAAACRARGIRVSPRAVLTARTITALTASVWSGHGGARHLPADTPPDGDFALSPAQAAMLTPDLAGHEHWNQAALFAVAPDVDTGALRAAVDLLVTGHGSLRLRFTAGPGRAVRQHVGPAPSADPLWMVSLAHRDEDELPGLLRRFADAAHRSLDLTTGRLLRVVHVDLGPRRPGRLLVVVHQLAFDMFSWPILTDDLQRLYRELTTGPAAPSCAELTPYQAWVGALARHARTRETEAELAHWLRAAADPGAVPLDRAGADPVRDNVAATSDVVEVVVGAAETAALVRVLRRDLRTGVGEAVLWALTESLAAWSDVDSVRVDVLGHGREEDIADVDLSRTTGWFTSVTPVRVDLEPGPAPRRLAAVRDRWRAVPRGGIGFGAARTFGRPEVARRLRALPDAYVSFDFLGAADLVRGTGVLLGPAAGDIGPFVHPRWRRPNPVEVQGAVSGGELRLTWVYSTALHDRGTVEAAAARQHAALLGLLAA